ncbi:MAG: HAD family phosphatase [Faecalibacterium sp.]|nr:HAD family phosphatase [Faecalibacterium sp.]
MSKLRDKLYIFDLENTLCGPDGVVLPTNADMLQLLALRGARYTVISDCPPDVVERQLQGLPQPGAPVICSGGALLMDLQTGKTVQKTLMSRPDAQTIVWTLERAFPTVGLSIQICDGPFQIVRANYYTEEYLRARGFGGILIQLENVPENWLNVSVFAEPTLLNEVEEYLVKKVLAGEFVLNRRSPSQLLVQPQQASLAQTVQMVCEHANVALADVCALGCTGADAAWIGLAGYSTAVADAPTEVKLAAQQVSLCTAAEAAAAEFMYQSLKQFE